MYKTTRTLIIGAGPYGIALANELHHQGEEFVIVGQPFSLWFDHTHGDMPIRSDWQTSEIYSPDNRYSFKRFIQHQNPQGWQEQLNRRIDGPMFTSYLEQVRDQLPYQVITSDVASLCHLNIDAPHEGFVAMLDNGMEIRARHIVLATGIEPHRYLPQSLAKLEQNSCIHTWNVADFIGVTGKRILLVGRGQSAAEALAHLVPNNQVKWVCRKPPKFYNEPINLPAPVFKSLRFLSRIYYYLPKPIHKKLAAQFVAVTVTPDMAPKVSSVPQVHKDVGELELTSVFDTNGGPATKGQSGAVYSATLDEHFDVVVAATGYRYQLNNLIFLSSQLQSSMAARDDECPKVNATFESGVDNLYFVGGIAEPSHGPAMRFMMGAPYAARTVAKQCRSK